MGRRASVWRMASLTVLSAVMGGQRASAPGPKAAIVEPSRDFAKGPLADVRPPQPTLTETDTTLGRAGTRLC